MTGQNLAPVIYQIQTLGISNKLMVGQGYDSAASTIGHFKGVQMFTRESHPIALYVHCSAHFLNLALGLTCNEKYQKLLWYNNIYGKFL